MTSNKTLLLIIGFLLFLFGMIALVLSLIGLQLSFLAFIDHFGRGMGLLIRLIMIFGGIIIFYISQIDWKEKARLDQDQAL